MLDSVIIIAATFVITFIMAIKKSKLYNNKQKSAKAEKEKSKWIMH